MIHEACKFRLSDSKLFLRKAHVGDRGAEGSSREAAAQRRARLLARNTQVYACARGSRDGNTRHGVYTPATRGRGPPCMLAPHTSDRPGASAAGQGVLPPLGLNGQAAVLGRDCSRHQSLAVRRQAHLPPGAAEPDLDGPARFTRWVRPCHALRARVRSTASKCFWVLS